MGRDRAANRDELEEQQEDIISEAHPRGPRLAARTARAAPATASGDATESSAIPGPPGLDIPNASAQWANAQPADADGQPPELAQPDQ
eukprot:13898935-Heterocapsa_arctica.AAC.1